MKPNAEAIDDARGVSSTSGATTIADEFEAVLGAGRGSNRLDQPAPPPDLTMTSKVAAIVADVHAGRLDEAYAALASSWGVKTPAADACWAALAVGAYEQRKAEVEKLAARAIDLFRLRPPGREGRQMAEYLARDVPRTVQHAWSVYGEHEASGTVGATDPPPWTDVSELLSFAVATQVPHTLERLAKSRGSAYAASVLGSGVWARLRAQACDLGVGARLDDFYPRAADFASVLRTRPPQEVRVCVPATIDWEEFTHAVEQHALVVLVQPEAPF